MTIDTDTCPRYTTAAELASSCPDLSRIPWAAPDPTHAATLYRQALIADTGTAALDVLVASGRLAAAVGRLAAHQLRGRPPR
ncbi:MAG TPA: hypothetical protein VGJ13_05020 [Pseudonocardiaceae bacterium]|jgi:hypothetical protein